MFGSGGNVRTYLCLKLAANWVMNRTVTYARMLSVCIHRVVTLHTQSNGM